MPSHVSIANALNGKYFNQLTPQLQKVINFITCEASRNPLINCRINNDVRVKPNIEVVINNEQYYISVLNGDGNSVHEEQPQDFKRFMLGLGAPNDVVSCIHDLCYYNGHTTSFINAENNSNRLQRTREFFQSNRGKFITRALETGIYGQQPTKFVLWGDVSYCTIASIENVINKLMRSTASTRLIAVGGLTLQRKDQFVNNNIQFKWAHPSQDIS